MFKRKKYNYKFRFSCVEAVLIKGKSVNQLAKEKGVNLSNLRLWLLFYEHYGKEGLKPRSRKQYDSSFKLEVLEKINKEHLSLLEACVKYNIPSESILISWQKAYNQGGIEGLQPKTRGRPIKMDKPIKRKSRKTNKPLTREQELLKENEFLKAQNELLKKLHALVQVEQKRKP